MFMAIELNSCYRPGAPLQQRISSRLNRGTWLLPVPANQTYPSDASEASNAIARAQGIERNPPGEAGFREPKLFYDIFEPEGVVSWIRGVLLARARCQRELPAHARHRRVSTVRIGERTYGSDDGLAWRQSADGTTVELLGGLCERQIDRPTSWWVTIQ